MKPAWIVLPVIAAAAVGLWIASRGIVVPNQGEAPRGASTYIQINHQGSQNWTPPLLRIGTADRLPPEPLFMISRDLPAPPNLSFTQNVTVDDARFFSAARVTAGLICHEPVTDSWTELTVTVVVDGKLASYCLLDGEQSRDYIKDIKFAVQGGVSMGAGSLDSMARFLADKTEGLDPSTPDDVRDHLEATWTELRHDNSAGARYPVVLFGTKYGLEEAAKQRVGTDAIPLTISLRQAQVMDLVKNEACAQDAPGSTVNDDFHIRQPGGQGCKTYGVYGCYYLKTLYSLSLPKDAIANIEVVKTLASRLGCRPEGWGRYRYVELYFEDKSWARTSVVRLGTQAGLPPPEAGIGQIVLGDVQFRRLSDLLEKGGCTWQGYTDRSGYFVIAPYHDGLLQAECVMERPAAMAYLSDVVGITGSTGQPVMDALIKKVSDGLPPSVDAISKVPTAAKRAD